MNKERTNMKEEKVKSGLETTIEQCQQMQRLIDISAQGVIKLRDMTIGAESAALIEIQELEVCRKKINLFFESDRSLIIVDHDTVKKISINSS